MPRCQIGTGDDERWARYTCYCEYVVFKPAKSRKPKRSPALSITLVAANIPLISELSRYLQTAGVLVRPVPIVGRIVEVPRFDDAIVVFADDLEPTDVCALVNALPDDHRSPLLVIVTSYPRRYARLGVAEPHKRVLILPRPAWGWSIVDAVRACLERPVSLRNVS